MLTYITNECMPLEKMLARVQKHHPGDGCLLVKKAYEFAENAHRGQVRKSGEPYFIHPVSVASILTDLMIDAPLSESESEACRIFRQTYPDNCNPVYTAQHM